MPARHRDHWLTWSALFCAGMVGWAFLRVHTYVTAQDPLWYMALARQVLDGVVVADELAPGISFVSPGYTLLLAATRKAGGVFAPYWLNLGFGLAYISALSSVCRHLGRSGPGRASILTGTLLILLLGYPYNAHFLFYPFRGLPIYALMFIGFAVVLRAGERSFPARLLVGAGLAFAAAIAIREPAVFGCAGAALLILARRNGATRRTAATRLLLFLSPLIAGGLLIVIGGALRGKPINHQMLSWTRILFDQSTGGLLQNIGHTAASQLAYLRQALTLPGMLAAAFGAWHFRRDARVTCLLTIPCVLFFIFYSLYIPHYRYVLTILVFLAPLTWLGLAALLDKLPKAATIAAPAQIGTAVLLAALIIPTVQGLNVWGRDVGRKDILAFRDALQTGTTPGTVLFTPWECRYLADAAACFTHFTLRDPELVRTFLREPRPMLYADPLSGSASYEGFLDGSLDAPGLPVASILSFYADLVPRPLPGRPDGRLAFAGAWYAIYDVAPWSERTVDEYARVPHSHTTVFWFDFAERESGEPVAITIAGRDGAVLARGTIAHGAHLRGFTVPASAMKTGWIAVRAASNAPLPRRCLLGVQAGTDSMFVPFGPDRSLSTHTLLGRGFQPPGLRDRHGGTFIDSADLQIPIPEGAPLDSLTVTLRVSALGPGLAGTGRLASTVPGGPQVTTTFALDGTCHHQVTLRDPVPGRRTPIRIATTAEGTPPDGYRIDSIKLFATTRLP